MLETDGQTQEVVGCACSRALDGGAVRMNHTHNMLRFLRLKLDQVAHRINRAGMSDSPILRQARRKPDCGTGMDWLRRPHPDDESAQAGAIVPGVRDCQEFTRGSIVGLGAVKQLVPADDAHDELSGLLNLNTPGEFGSEPRTRISVLEPARLPAF